MNSKKPKNVKVLAIIQARFTSTRLPSKVLMKVGGKSMVARVCEAARDSKFIDKVVVAWAHKFPGLPEGNVLERFRLITLQYKPDVIVRLTSDCPLLKSSDIDRAIAVFNNLRTDYYSNHLDGWDVQVFKPELLWTNGVYHPEHVIEDFATRNTGFSVNTVEDLDRVRKFIELCETK